MPETEASTQGAVGVAEHSGVEGGKSEPSDAPLTPALAERTRPAPLYQDRGQRLGRYLLLDELGRGGMGVVHTAFDEDLGRKIAIKLVNVQGEAPSPAERTRLLREAQALAMFTHPNIVTVFDVGESDQGIFVAMEYVPGSTLRQWRSEEKQWWRKVQVFLEAGRGLAAAHAAGLVHRDFKPDNVLISRDGRVKVADFGLARVEGAIEDLETTRSHRDVLGEEVTRTGARMGTPAYMAPEQHKGEAATAQSDQFAFCVALWETLFGVPPFGRGNKFELTRRVTSGQRDPAPAGHGISLRIVRALERGLLPDPSSRHASMDHLLTELEQGLAQAGLHDHLGRRPAFGRNRPHLIAGRYQLLEPDPRVPRLERAFDRLEQNVAFVMTWGEGRAGVSHRFLGGLNHPHLVKMLDFGYDDVRGAYATYDLPGDADLLVTSGRRQPLDLQLHYLVEVLRALGFLHDLGLVDVDLRPESVLVVGGRARLLVEQAHMAPLSPKELRRARARDLSHFAQVAFALFSPLRSATAALDWSAVDLDPELRQAFAALGKEDGPLTAEAFIHELSEATGRRFEYETHETREATLRAVSLVGREDAQEDLRRALTRAIDGEGSTVLIVGESGIGKTRLVEFAESVAHESGHLVLRGQAVEFDTVPYLVWQRPLALLALTTQPTDFEASVLALVVPELGRMLDGDVVRATEFDAMAMQTRLADVVTSLLARSARSVVFLLEDLHWAGAESLALLDAVQRAAGRLRALVVASARPDGQVDELVRWDTLLHIGALSKEDVAEHVARLPVPRAERAALARYAFERSEGQPLFLAETLRALAEHAGAFSSIRVADVPSDLRTGGLMRALRKRLAALPESARPLLRLAAAQGRRIDRELLCSLASEQEVDDWLALLISHAVLQHRGGAIEFSHDKLRDAALEDVPEEERHVLHRRIASALEQRFEGGGNVAAAELVHYFTLAGNIEKEAKYGLLAGEELVHQRPDDAMHYLQRGLFLGTPKDPIRAARFQRMLAEAAFDQGKLDEARLGLEGSLTKLGGGVVRTNWRLPLQFLRQLAIQVLHLVRMPREAKPSERERGQELMRSYEKMSELQAFRGENLAMLTSALAAINQGDRLREVPLASLGIIGYLAAALRLGGISRRYFARGRAALAAAPSRFHPYFFLTAAFAEFLAGQSAPARATLLEGHDRARQLGHALGAAQCMSALGLVEWAEGNFHAMLDCYDRVLDEKAYVAEHDAANFGGKATALAHLGRLEEARTCDARAAEGGETKIANMAIAIHAGRSFVQSYLGAHRDSCAAADRAMEGADVQSLQSALIISLWGPHHAYLTAWEVARRDEPERVRELRRKAYAQLERFTRFCRVVPVARGFAWLAAAQVARQDGRPGKARRLLDRALPLLERHAQRYGEALARTELARLLPRGSSERAQELVRAKAVFATCGAVVELALVRELEQAS